MKRIEQKVISFIKDSSLINKNDKILVALSGGPDSVFLLKFLVKFKQKYQIELSAIHINHMIRGKDALADQEFCRNLSLSLGIKFYSVKKNVRSFAKKNKLSIEEAGRNLRYKEFGKLIGKLGYNKIATAHNSSDNAETVLLNLIKGAGLKGLSGIPVKRGEIIRPVLCLTKEEILGYLNYYKIDFMIDKTNLGNDYERSFIRNSIIPLIKQRLNPDLENAVFHSAEIFKDILSYVDGQARGLFNSSYSFSGGELKISLAGLNQMAPEIRGHFFKTVISESFGMQTTFSDFRSLKALIESEAGKEIDLSGGFKAFRDREFIIILRSKIAEGLEPVNIRIGKSYKINGRVLLVETVDKAPGKFPGNKLIEYISGDGLYGDFILRPWNKGERFFPIGFNGSQKVSDFLNGQKISSLKKKEQLVLINNGRIVWVLGLRLDDRFKVLKNTEKVIKLCLK